MKLGNGLPYLPDKCLCTSATAGRFRSAMASSCPLRSQRSACCSPAGAGVLPSVRRAGRRGMASQRAAEAVAGVSTSEGASSSGLGAAPLSGRFRIPHAEVQAHLSQHGLAIESFLVSLIRPASKLARPPVSGYYVGAAGLGASGSVYIGVNLEFPGAPLNNSVHAEQFLVVNCLHNQEDSLRMLAVSAAPCGHCRQFYAELHRSDEIAFLFGSNPQPRLLDELLPGRFGPQDLSPDGPFPLLMQLRDNGVSFEASSEALLQVRSLDLPFQAAAAEALAEARKAYSPYTKCPSGAAIVMFDGQVYAGGCIESAAYNPSLSPFHTAYIGAVAGGVRDPKQIREVVLAEVAGAPVQHRHNIQLLLDRVAPQAKLTLMELQAH